MHYRYQHTATEATTGYFSCEPDPVPPLREALIYLAEHPLDDFMRRHLLNRLTALSAEEMKRLLLQAFPAGNLPEGIQALLQELAVVNPAQFASLAAADDAASNGATSLIFLRWRALPDRKLQQEWGRLFSANIRDHRILKNEILSALAPLYPEAGQPPSSSDGGKPEIKTRATPGQREVFQDTFSVQMQSLHKEHAAALPENAPAYQRPPASETSRIAEERLSALGIIAGQEMRHTASLSPVALLRPWHIRLAVRNGSLDYTLDGQATTYGRGLSVADARASCLMEMVERASVYLSVADGHVTDRVSPMPLIRGTRTEILSRFGSALDPNDFPLEVTYEDAPLHWVKGQSCGSSSENGDMYVPVQMVGLFCNLDEVSLFEALGSTGIATGCTLAEAKIAALLEIFERDAEATTPFSKDNCFLLEAEKNTDPIIAALLADYAARGISVQFQDITGPMGVPVFQCFVTSPKGAIARGYGAGLSARRAVISALTETPFPYPDGGPSGPALRKLPRKALHELPDYSLPDPQSCLALLEELLVVNGRAPVYVDVSRKGLEFPVVRAFIPGMELNADTDAFSRVPVRLYANWRKRMSA